MNALMRTVFLLSVWFSMGGTEAFAKASFSTVWSQVASDPYRSMPYYQTTFSSFFVGGGLFSAGVNVLKSDAERTLVNEQDLLPWFQKRVHPVGICFAGTWTVTETTPYTGYFVQGSKGLIIVRASEALGQQSVGDYRAFGLAGKIFPTANPSDKSEYKTANFFTIDDLGGTMADSFHDLAKTNEPDVSKHLSTVFMLPMLSTIVAAFATADEHPQIRQVYPIAQLGLADPTKARAPTYMALASETRERPGLPDFRDELRLVHYADGLRFSILVAEPGQDQWRRIGVVHLTDEALSDSCDHRLHFKHPRWR